MDAWCALLDPMNVQAPLGKLDLMPLQVAQLRGPQAMPIGDQDHRGVAVTTAAVLAGGPHQPLDLLLGQIPTGSGLWNCQLYSAWCRALGCRKHRNKLSILTGDCLHNALFVYTCKSNQATGRVSKHAMMPYSGLKACDDALLGSQSMR